VCEAAGVAASALYRQFGDKEGLLSAVVDNAFEKYLASKRAVNPSADPVRDLRRGWDDHIAFALANPNHYRLMHSPAVHTPPPSAAEAYRLLEDVLERCAAAGRLTVSTSAAAQMIMSANVGVALSMISQPATYRDPRLSERMRDAVHTAVLAAPVEDPESQSAGGQPAETGRVAAALAALLRRSPAAALSSAEAALLQEWLTRLADRHE
jgi:AcrR family transcriptional regulator